MVILTSPSTRSTLARWLDADTITDGIDGEPYSGSWDGLYSQPTASHQPAYLKTGAEGLACLQFSGNQSIGSGSDPAFVAAQVGQATGSGGYTITAVFSHSEVDPVGNTDASYQTAFDAGGGIPPGWIVTSPVDAKSFSIQSFQGAAGGPPFPRGQLCIVQHVVEYTSANICISTLYLNGIQTAKVIGTAMAGVSGTVSIGALADGRYGISGLFSQFLIDNAPLSSDQLSADIAYFASGRPTLT